MADRTFQPLSFTLVKRKVELYAAVSVGAVGAVTLQKWNYPTFGNATAPAQTYTAATTATAGLGNRGFLQYNASSQGVYVVALALLSATAAALDPANGEVMLLTFTLADATEA